MAMSPERKAERKAARDRAKYLNSLTPIADAVKPVGGDRVIALIDGVEIAGNVADVNKALEKMGFRPVRITRNILNDKSPEWCVDINTPAYLDPGCESYHSM